MPYLASNSSGFAGARQFEHRELVDLDAVHAQFAGDGIAEAAFGIMIFHGQHEVVRLLRGALMTSLASGFTL